MKQTTGIPIVVIVLCHLLFPSASAANEAEEKIQQARAEFYKCQVENVQQFDGASIDARDVALALTNHCAREYSAQNKVIARYNLENHNQRRMFTIDQNAEVIKIEASLEVVNLNRRGELPILQP